MHLTCPHCAKQMSVPDEKVPAGKRFKIVCPQCSQPFTVDPPLPGKVDIPGDQASAQPREPEESIFYPPGAKVAYLFLENPSWQAALTSLLEEQGYFLASVDTGQAALRKIESTAYELIFLEHCPQTADVLRHIHGWPGLRRRTANVILIGNEAKSLHPDASFRHGVNFYLHLDDHKEANRLVQTVIAGNDENYKLWRLASDSLAKSHT